MNVADTHLRPLTLSDVSESSSSLEDFGRNLRDWQHEVQRGGVHSRGELARRLLLPPGRLADRFPQGDVADAMLAAYAEWLSDRAGIPRPQWCRDSQRVADTPWFGSPLRGWLIAHTHRGISKGLTAALEGTDTMLKAADVVKMGD